MIFHENAFLQGENAHGAPFRLVGAIEHVTDRCRKSKVFFVTSIYDDRCYTSKSTEKTFDFLQRFFRLFSNCLSSPLGPIQCWRMFSIVFSSPPCPVQCFACECSFSKAEIANLHDNIEWGTGNEVDVMRST